MDKPARKSFGIIGGLGVFAGADVFLKLIKLTSTGNRKGSFDIVFEQHPFSEDEIAGGQTSNQNARKMYIFEMIRQFEQRNIGAVILPCFISHTFLKELEPEIKIPVINIMRALRWHLERRHSKAHRLGVVTSDYVKKKELFAQYFKKPRYKLIYPSPYAQKNWLMRAIYDPSGAKGGNLEAESIKLLFNVCRQLMNRGAQVILPGFTELSMMTDKLREFGVPILDANQIYAQYAVSQEGDPLTKVFKIGIIGGLGPAATTAFMNKIIHHTQAKNDQEHLKLVVEHNPKIPDRTENLIADGPDPTISLYSACKRLEAADADVIAIPCNTAHAFVERIQPYLSIPIINMLFETLEYIRNNYGRDRLVGLLATTGTIKSRVYHDIVEKTHLRLIVPNDKYQRKVMETIYGEKGLKAGYTHGQCKKNLELAIRHLVQRGAEIIVLGCTELPLLFSQSDIFLKTLKCPVIVDPTEILARKCVSLSRQ